MAGKGEVDHRFEDEGHEQLGPGKVPTGVGNAAPGGEAAPPPRRPATGTRRGKDAEGERPQETAAGLTARKSCWQVKGYVGGLQRSKGKALRCAPLWAGTMNA